jgi:hypothetical protein
MRDYFQMFLRLKALFLTSFRDRRPFGQSAVEFRLTGSYNRSAVDGRFEPE